MNAKTARPEAIREQAISIEKDVDVWLGMPLTRYTGGFLEIASVVPRFARRPFQTAAHHDKPAAANPYYDAIVRLPARAEDAEIPVGVVSPTYQLIQHTHAIERVAQVLKEQHIDPALVRASISLTPYGERMALSVVFPDEARFNHSIDGEDSMRCRLELFNSVDGSTKFMVFMGWLRFVCGNGLVNGRTLASIRRAHAGDLDLESVAATVANGIRDADRQRTLWEQWQMTAVTTDRLKAWVDSSLKRKWEAKAAARLYSICMSGWDLVLTEPFESAAPSERSGKPGVRVTGAPLVSETAFDVAQALSWLAGRRSDISRRLQATREIPGLVHELIRRAQTRIADVN
jgi:hypothetical protein